MSKAIFALLSLLPHLISAANDWSIPCMNGQCSYDIPSSESSMAGTLSISGSPHAISDITPAAGWQILNCTADADAQNIRIVCAGDDASCSHLSQNGAEHTIIRLPPDCGSAPFARVSQYGESDDQSLPDHIKSRIMRRDGTTPPVHALSFDTNFGDIPSSQHGNVSMLIFGSTIPGLTGNATITPPGSRRRSRLVNKRGLFDSLFGDFNKTTSKDLPPIDVDKKFNIFNTTLSCSANEQAKLSVDVEAKLHAQVSVGIVATGSVVPPKIKKFGLFSGLSADLEGGLTIDANIAGEVDTGKIPLFTMGLPGLDIPKIFSLGPTFEIDAEAKATVDLDVNMAVDLAYGFSDLQLFFPPSAGHSSNAVVAPKDTPLKLSASPSVQSNATFEAHLIPTLKFGLSLFSEKADVFLNLDTFAALDLGLEAGATGSVDSTGATDASAHVGGCVDVNGGVSINAGADASFFGLFDDTTQVALFSKNFDFFKKCFDESTDTTSSATVSVTSSSSTTSASASASAQTSQSGISSNTSFDPSASASAADPFESITASSDSTSLTGSFTPSGSATSSSSILSASASASAQTSQSSVSSNTSFNPSASASAADPSESITASSDPASPTSSFTSSSSSAPSSASASSATSSSSSSSKRLSTRGFGFKASGKTESKLAKRGFQCLAADVAAATSIVDKTLSSSSISS